MAAGTRIQLVTFLLSLTVVRGDELRFLVIGDWGGIPIWPYTTPYETAVSSGMGKIAQQLGTQFTVALGDNFYLSGVKNVDDKRFQETFESVFTAKSLMTPWYFCAGNHDHRGNVSAQIAYSSKSQRWNFPDFYYTKSWTIPGSDETLQLVLLDTVLLCGNSGYDRSHAQPEGPESIEDAEAQWDWLEATLRSSTAHYLIVGGHYPVWSIAEHGPTKCLVERLRPLLQKYNVTAYISGHDHNLQSICETDRSPCGENIACIPDYQEKTVRCNCSEGYTGKPCKPKSCAQLFQDGFTSNGVYSINPDGGEPIQVLCDMVTDGGGWTVFQRRLDGSVDFFLGWESYKNGFGNLNGEFWLGNDNLHRLTAADDVALRVDLEDFEGDVRYAEYTIFKVANEEDEFQLLIGGYSGTAGDSLSFHNNQPFFTKDSDNAGSCAQTYKGAWWYKTCHGSNLNGLYHGGPHSTYGDGVCWKAFRGFQYSLKRAEMKMKFIYVG